MVSARVLPEFCSVTQGPWTHCDPIPDDWRSYLAEPTSLDINRRVEILSSLHQWLVDTPANIDGEILESIVTAAEVWCDWPLIVHLLEVASTNRPLRRLEIVQLTHAYWQTGRTSCALDRLRPLLIENPESSDVWRLYDAINEWQGFCRTSGFDTFEDDESDLSLQLLGHQHHASFAATYCDPSISHLCGLPDFHDAQQWHAWLNQRYALADEMTFVISHRYWGMVGSTSLIMNGPLGFCYYWIGKEFRGRGFGPGAISILLKLAKVRYGLQTCYAKVYDHNTASRRCLEKLKFEQLDFQSVFPHADKIFYRLGQPMPRYTIANELRELLWRIGCSSTLAVPVAPQF